MDQVEGWCDVAALQDVSEEAVLSALRSRHVYTYIGDILIAVNPLRDLPIYGAQVSDEYSRQPIRSLPPHIFAVADGAYRNLQSRNQTIVISGDSGAGKTESTKLLLQHLVRRSRGSSQLCQQILQVNPLLEAFGNAQTMMNQNSSRFGKYIQLRFSQGTVKGAKINEYLLEKSRVSHQDPGERNFHVFYSMLYGCPEEERQVYGLLQPSIYRYIGQSKEELHCGGWEDRYHTLCNAMRMVGFHTQEELDLKTILSGVLSLGNIGFAAQELGGVTIEGGAGGWLKAAAGQFGVQEEDLQDCLVCTMSVMRGEMIRRLHSQQQAEDARDSIARVVYSRMFGWIVTKSNELLAGDVDHTSVVQEIGILDIFGFENFAVNRFEQFCINLANEQLQNFFNQHIFVMEHNHYVQEGIQQDGVTFQNNQLTLDLFLARPAGILSILDEQTSFPQASDATLVEKLCVRCKANPHFERARGRDPGFIIHHYAGKVQYVAMGFLEKNRDAVPTNIQNLFINSVTDLLSLLFTASVSRTGTLMPAQRAKAQILQEGAAARKMSVGAQFRRSLGVLMEKMYAASPHFIRCIKPNNEKLPGVFHDEEVLRQLRYNGVMETLRIRRDGFSWRPSFQEFVERYGILLLTPHVSITKESCVGIVQRVALRDWQCGTSRLFFKYWHQDELNQQLLKLHEAAAQIQKCYKGLCCRRRYRKILEQMKMQEELERDRERARLRELEARQLEARQLERDRDRLRELEARQLEARQLEARQLERDRARLRELEARQLEARQLEQDRDRLRELEARQLERDRARLRELEARQLEARQLEAQQSSMQPIPIPRKRAPPIRIKSGDVPLERPVPRPRSQLIELSPFDNAVSRVPSVTCEDGELRQIQRRKTLLWFRETQARKVLDDGTFPPWLHGMISRRDAESLLMNNEVGNFLIRISQSQAGYILSYRGAERCRHYMIDVRCNGCYVIVGEDRAHSSLSAVIQYHRTIGVQPYGETLRDACHKVADREADCEELKLLSGVLSGGEENIASTAAGSASNQSEYRKLEKPHLPRFHKSIRKAMHEIQQTSTAQKGLAVGRSQMSTTR